MRDLTEDRKPADLSSAEDISSLSSPARTEFDKPLAEIPPVSAPFNVLIAHREDFVRCVDPPLLLPCQFLYDLNIRTDYSSAASDDVGKNIRLSIDTITLSEENLRECRRLEAEGLGHFGTTPPDWGEVEYFQITIPVGSDITFLRAQGLMMKAIEGFQLQPLKWGCRSLEEIRNDPWLQDAGSADPEELSRQTGYIYDEKSGLFYFSDELYQKAQVEH